MNNKSIFAAAAIFFLTGCTMGLTTQRHEINQPLNQASRVAISINDGNIGAGTQSFVNASILAEIKSSVPNATLVAVDADLTIDVNLLPAHLMGRWYTALTLGALKQYYQLGTVRVVNSQTDEIIAIHDILVKGRRVLPIDLEEYRVVILPSIVDLVKEEMGANGISARPLVLDMETMDIASLP